MKETTQDHYFNGHRIATAFHEANAKSVVIFCHGYRGANIGPNRFFVTAARQLADRGISSLRFDQYGSGNSEGDFFNSSFFDWVKTIQEIAGKYLTEGYRVALFGQSMGGAAVIAAGSELQHVSAIVAWSPDPNVGDFVAPEHGVLEESGQIVQARFWQEAHDARIADKLSSVTAPMYIVQCTADEYVDEQNRNAITTHARANHRVEHFEGYPHSKWTFEQSNEIIHRSVDFLVQHLKS